MNVTKSVSLIILFVLFLGLAACQDDQPTILDGERSTESVEIPEGLDPGGALVVYWHALTGTAEAHLLEMIDDFNTSNEWGITVVGEYQGDLQALTNRVLAGISSNQLPSLVMTTPNLAAVYASQGVAVPLAPYVENKSKGLTRTELNDFYSGTLTSDQLPQFKDQLVSFPTCRSLQVLYYNATWLNELGYAAPPQTWNEFREMACAASKPIDGFFGFELGMDSSIYTSMLGTNDITLFDADSQTYTLGDALGRAVLQLLQDLIDDSCAQWETEKGITANFGAGKILFVIDSTSQLPTYRSASEGAGFEWAVASLPHSTNEPVVSVYGVSSTILHSTPEEQLAAWLFIKWLAEPAQQARWSETNGCYPTRRSAFEEMATYLEEHPQYNVGSQFLEYEWIPEPGVTTFEICRAEIGRMLYAVTAGESVEQWFADTLNLCNQTLTESSE